MNLPEFSLGYVNQSMIGTELSNNTIAAFNNRFHYISLGISAPLFMKGYKAETQKIKIETDIALSTYRSKEIELQSKLKQQKEELNKQREIISYYETGALKQVEELVRIAKKGYDEGEIPYTSYLQAITDANTIQLNYIEALRNYNLAIIKINYLTAQ